MEKPILFGSKYIMKPGMTYRDICIAMRLNDEEIEAGMLALELLNGPELAGTHLTTEMAHYDKAD